MGSTGSQEMGSRIWWGGIVKVKCQSSPQGAVLLTDYSVSVGHTWKLELASAEARSACVTVAQIFLC